MKKALKYILDKNLIMVLMLPGLAIFIILVVFVSRLDNKKPKLTSQAENSQAQVYLTPAKANLPPESAVQLSIYTEIPVSFAHFEITFDKNIVKLSKDISINGPLTRVVKPISISQANTNGRVIIILGLDPSNRNNPPTGDINLAQLTFTTNTSSLNQTSTISCDVTKSQLVAKSTTIFNIAAFSSVLTVNPVSLTNTPIPPTNTPVPTRTPTPKPPTQTPAPTLTSSPTPIQQTSTIKVYAAGTEAQGVYPTMQLLINDQKVAEWTNVRGNMRQRSFQEYVYFAPIKVISSQVKVRFTNDAYRAWRYDRNLAIDRINIDGINYQSEASTTYSVGSWDSSTGCDAGYKKSEWLHCNGYFQY